VQEVPKVARRAVLEDESMAELSLKSRVAVIGRDAAEVVRFSGGWMFDQALAGWDVNVLTLDDGNVRPLRILGANPHDLAPLLAPGVAVGQCLHAVVVPADLYHAEEGVRRIARNAMEAGSAELLLWDDDQSPVLGLPGPVSAGHGPVPVRHRLSLAARAFKAQALAAARVPDADAVVAEAEVFRSLLLP
jgi:hypothetical protein